MHGRTWKKHQRSIMVCVSRDCPLCVLKIQPSSEDRLFFCTPYLLEHWFEPFTAFQVNLFSSPVPGGTKPDGVENSTLQVKRLAPEMHFSYHGHGRRAKIWCGFLAARKRTGEEDGQASAMALIPIKEKYQIFHVLNTHNNNNPKIVPGIWPQYNTK
ncbi:hypothetical protein CEXT_608991 [Caerostris extrusa]|uniref:Uncharacterized protein n=1 Tax=Caerostris extrusa TaxID=172846 RepID=A0AAV4XFQ6_CAEEX|nr:hypothetical protein CEXT_608991 [Caerostris extrusa]